MEDTLDTVLGLSMPKASEDTLKHLIPAGVRSAKRRINTADLRHVVDFGVWGRLGRWWARERFAGGRSGGVGSGSGGGQPKFTVCVCVCVCVLMRPLR